MTPLTLIAAVAENGVIGRDNAMPWHMPSDLKLFRANTLGKPVVLGRRNFESIGRPLPKRLNIVLSRQTMDLPGCITTTRFDEALLTAHAEALRSGAPEICIIGGAEIYALALPYASRILLSRIHAMLEGDIVFPALSDNDWQIVCAEPQPKGQNDDFAFTLLEYGRKSPVHALLR